MDKTAVLEYLHGLQDSICAWLSSNDPQAELRRDQWQRPQGGGGDSRVFSDGELVEKGGVNFSHIRGEKLPDSATHNRPELAGLGYEAMGVSLVIHPRNPYVPTTHMNLRFFLAGEDSERPAWWFGGGYDLTPYYGFEEDCIHWHQSARAACAEFGEGRYEQYKQWCDEYFYIKHRQEARGIGGLFFDDIDEQASGGFARGFAFIRAVGDSFLAAYTPIVERRAGMAWGEREREFQLYRRGRYVEFNLVHDRGTLFGLQSNGRVESILMSLPPLVRWEYNFQPEPGSAEAALYADFLPPREWL